MQEVVFKIKIISALSVLIEYLSTFWNNHKNVQLLSFTQYLNTLYILQIWGVSDIKSSPAVCVKVQICNRWDGSDAGKEYKWQAEHNGATKIVVLQLAINP